MTVHRTTLAAPLVFLVHDLEEIMQVRRMNAIGRDMRERLPEPIRRPLAKIRYTPGPGNIPFHKTGAHRRIYFEDLTRYRDVRDAERRKALRDLTRKSAEYGLDY